MKTIRNVLYKTTLFALALGLSQLSQAFVSYSLLKKGDQTVLILGVLHRPPANAKMPHEQWVNRFLTHLRHYDQHSVNQLLSCLYEFPPYDDDAARLKALLSWATKKQIIGDKILDKIFVTSQTSPFKKTILIPSDIRNRSISESLQIYLDIKLDTILVKPFKMDYLEGSNEIKFKQIVLRDLPEFNDCKNALKADTKAFNITIKDYLEKAENEKLNMLAWKKDHLESSNIFDEIYLRYEKSLNEIKKILEASNENQSFIGAVLEYLSKYTWYDASIQWKRIRDLIIEELDSLYADAGFLHQILFQQKNNIEKIILVAGNAHALNIVQVLTKYGYSEVQHMTIIGSLNSHYKHIDVQTIENRQYSEFSSNLFNILIDDILCLKAHICASCEKYSSDSLQICDKCKNRYYCSVECQKQDWPQHKPNCTSLATRPSNNISLTACITATSAAAAAAAVATNDLRQTKHFCAVCQKESTTKCSICKKQYYCSKDCQCKDWPQHKQICKK